MRGRQGHPYRRDGDLAAGGDLRHGEPHRRPDQSPRQLAARFAAEVNAERIVRIGRALAIDDRGGTLMEYGLILMLIAGVVIALLSSIGNSVHDIFAKLNTSMLPPSKT